MSYQDKSPMTGSQQRISTETALQLLTNQQRRQILRQLAETSGWTTVDQLKKDLGVTDSVTPEGNGSIEHRGIELHHVHLPKLADANVITYDGSQGTVHRGQAFQDVFSLLEMIDQHRDSHAAGCND
jgi:hypothetical protein